MDLEILLLITISGNEKFWETYSSYNDENFNKKNK